MSKAVVARMAYHAHVYNHRGCSHHHCDEAERLYAEWGKAAGF